MSTEAPRSVRLARTSDVDDVAAVQVRAWQAAYDGVLPHDILGSLNPSDIALEWGRALLLPGSSRLLVAIDDNGHVVGAAAVGPADEGTGADGCGELSLLVVEPTSWRQGHGSRLLAASVDLLVQMGHREAITWIPIDDEPRRAFLLSAGWGPDGAYRDLAVSEEVVVREVRMVTVIGD